MRLLHRALLCAKLRPLPQAHPRKATFLVGGCFVSACMKQRQELFDSCLPGAGVLERAQPGSA